eukprot:11149970-Alexandrium_andersonii.AAC.1
MSASLVGSEMCIRDRARVMRLGSPSPRTRAFLDQHPFVDADAADLFRDCLLYTSDAADDM